MPFVTLWFERTIGFEEARLPLPEVVLLGQLARRPKAVEHVGVIRMGIKECSAEIPEPPVGLVVEGKALAGIEDCDAGRELIKCAAMSIGHPLELCLQRGRLADVDGDAGAAGAGGNRV